MKKKILGLIFLSGLLIIIPMLAEMEWIPNNYLATNKKIDKNYILSQNIIIKNRSCTTDNIEYDDLPLSDSNDGLIDGIISNSYKDWFRQPEYNVIYLD